MKPFLLAIMLLAAGTPALATRVYIKANATGANNGTSWTDAYTKLDSIVSGTGFLTDTVWVANGTYYPPSYNGSNWPYAFNGFSPTLKIFGGFSGTETQLSQRNWTSYQTVLDADIGVPGVKTDNAPGIVGLFFDAPVCNFVLDGFKVANSNANSGGFGSAISVLMNSAAADSASYFSTIKISNCYFVNNTGNEGGAIGLYGKGKGQISINYCRFERDTALVDGGAIANNIIWYRGPLGRHATGRYEMTVTDCSFRACYAPNGGAISVSDSTTIINRCSFIGNAASRYGGAIYDSSNVRTSVYSSLFAGNAAQLGAAHYTPAPYGYTYKPHTYYHCTFSGNRGTIIGNNLYTLFTRGADTLRNNIFWGNSPGTGVDLDTPLAAAVVHTNLIENSASLPNTAGTVSFNPLSTAPGLASASPFPLSSNYNYHLGFISPAIDAGATIILAAPFNLDLEGHTRWQGTAPDLGAYEWRACTPSAMNVSVATSGPTTFCVPGSVTLTASAIGNLTAFSWNGAPAGSPSYTATSSGTVVLVAMDTSGCRTTISTPITAVPPPNPVITISGNTLSVPPIYATYQWYNGSVAIAGATASSYNPPSNGNYSVAVTTTSGNCPGTSAVYNLRNLGVGITAIASLQVYPNPASDVMYIEGPVEGAEVALYSMVGSRMEVPVIRVASGMKVDLSRLAPASYIIRISTADGYTNNLQMVKE